MDVDSEIARLKVKDCQKIIDQHVNFVPKDGSGWESCPELPTPKEIMEKQDDVAGLPHNPVDRPWDSKEEYLAAQYQVLRREGIEGLRYSVRCYIQEPDMTDNQHTSVYVGVRVRGYLLSRLGPIARIEFSTSRSPLQIRWLQSKRLTPGTIVALTTKADNFKSICKIATIAQRPYTEGLDQTPPLVDLMWADPRDAVFDPDTELVMVESRNGYFESTRHALVGLQHVAQGASPLDKYLTGLHTTEEAPLFVKDNPIMDLSTLVHIIPEGDEDTYDDLTEPLRDHNILTGLPDLGRVTTLDHSQLEALHRILSTELAIVQGPPGTGKTFTSVEALKIMIKRRQTYGGPPIIISAQTNHALDQLLTHCLDADASICRVGGRTESEVIRAYTVYEIRLRDGGSRDQRYKQLLATRYGIERKIRDMVNDVFGDHLLSPLALLQNSIITQAQFDSLHDDSMETGTRSKELGPFALWLGDDLIQARIARDRHPTQEEVDEAAEKVMADWEFDGDMDNIAEDPEDAIRIAGDLVLLNHVWTGKEPGFVRKWEHHVERELKENDDFFDIEPHYRGGVYRRLQTKLVQALTPKFTALIVQHRTICNALKAHRWFRDAQLLEKTGVDVVGCTTTGLTKYRGLLAALRPQSLLIEEAAETREANITSALYPSLEQLILVGDHQQLAPRCDIRWLGEEPYNLNVSLFQRMVNLNMPFKMLKEQRRMKPEIRYILTPFYPELLDHPSVQDESRRPSVPGMGSRNCWYFNHNWPEDTNSEHSKYNEQEADMVIKFFAYLVSNGTDPTRITILTFYKGQRKLLLNRLKREGSMRLPGNSFRVHTVDSYQGEENDIVLLSLVRSPAYGNAAGFLDDQRRAVVAISRARIGFYIFGNIDNLLKAHHECLQLWGQIWNGFAQQGRVKRALGLPLICQKHGNETWVKEVEDWGDNAGGCDQPCHEMRPCGHACTLKCHFTEHERLPCSEPCRNTLECGDGCVRYCSQACYCTCDRFRDIQIAREAEQARLAKIAEEEEEKPFEQQLAEAMPGIGFFQAAANQALLRVPSNSFGDEVSFAGTNESSPEKWNEFTVNIKEHDARLVQESRRLAADAGTPTKIRISDTYNSVALVDGRRTKHKGRSTQKLEVSNVTRSERARAKAATKSRGNESLSSSSGGKSVSSSPSEDDLLYLKEVDLLTGPDEDIVSEKARIASTVPKLEGKVKNVEELLIDVFDLKM
ncbi:P-loop containing nucleoside triphosphate hydrolase protein [Rhypophila sp. PSN 637]